MTGLKPILVAAQSSSLFDDSGASVIANATKWIEGALLGQIATTLAVLALAGLGFAMLTGRLPVRRGLLAVLGCFVLFGAPVIARGILSALRSEAQSIGGQVPLPPSYADISRPKRSVAEVDDPYAGAAVPN
jgi:type IV secretory pathway VirB2 component (pilin)